VIGGVVEIKGILRENMKYLLESSIGELEEKTGNKWDVGSNFNL